MPHYKTLVDCNFVGSWDLPPGKDAVVVIEKVERYVPERKLKVKRKLPDGREVKVDEPSKRIKITFRGKRKPWLAGPVSQKTLASMFGPNTDHWVGKAVSLYSDPTVEFAGVTTGGLRVRPTPPKIGTPPTADPLDRPVDEEKAQAIADAKEAVTHE